MFRILTAATANTEEPAPADQPTPANYVVTTYEQLIAALRDRCEQLNLPRRPLDDLAGLQDGYCSKLLCQPPIKNLGPMSFPAILGALGLGVAVVVLTEDFEAADLVRNRWVKRKRNYAALQVGASLDQQHRCTVEQDQQPRLFDDGDETEPQGHSGAASACAGVEGGTAGEGEGGSPQPGAVSGDHH